jgi:flagellar biosynthetic protein FliR
MSEAQLLAELPQWAFAFALVLARCGAAIMLLPGLGESEPPAVVRIGLTLGLVALLLPGIGTIAEPPSLWRGVAMLAAEMFCGGVLGWLARLMTLALPVAGQMISYMLGLSNVVQLDVTLGQSSALMRLFDITVPVLVLGTGLWMLPVAALSGSYTLVPPGAMLPMADSVQAVMAAVTTSFALSLQLAAPFVFAGMLWQMALGLMGRVIPHLQIYFAAIPGQIVGGLVLLALLATGLLDAWSETIRTSFGGLPGL